MEHAKPAGLFLQRRFELFSRLRSFIYFQQHLAQQLAAPGPADRVSPRFSPSHLPIPLDRCGAGPSILELIHLDFVS
jgi:hypothetical protein